MNKSVPIIDLHPFRTGDEEDRRRVARAVDEACREIGFLVVEGHGVPLDLLEKSHAAARRFFDLGVATKQRYEPAPGAYAGYRGVGSEALSYSLDQASPPDLKEAFSVGREDRADIPYFTNEQGRMVFQPNQWPTEVPEIKETWAPLYRALDALSIDVMRVFALGLDLPLHFFDGVLDKSIGALRALNYPEQKETPLPGQLRAGAHTDYGTLTFVSMDDAPGGLEVDRGGGAWEAVHAPPSALVLNIGDMMARWTNDRWVSTHHRVQNPPPDANGSTRRQSLVFFHNPNYDAEIVPLPTCCTPDRPSKYERTTSGEYLYMKMTKAGNVTKS